VGENGSRPFSIARFILAVLKSPVHVKWVPCHHGMVGPQVTNGGNGLQIWEAAAIILNKQ
jgi:hypothetical protein